MKKNCKVFVGMSGGVDSSVSAALLKEEGYDVVGVFIKVWQADFLPCTWREERRDAMRAAAHLGIPFLTLDLEQEYKKEVVDYMIHEYGAGRTPNPDVMCNKHVKFGAFLRFAQAKGADAVATGHYARITQPAGDKNFELHVGVDSEKDQSYFLWTLTQEQLAQILFPVGHLQKTEVRQLAEKFGLPNAQKKDSQGLCFMGPVDMASFLKHYLKVTPGDVLNESGEIIGQHEGALLYTIGQRHGFVTTKRSSDEHALYVTDKDITHNTITVTSRKEKSTSQTTKKICVVNMNIFPNLHNYQPNTLSARIRYRGQLNPLANISTNNDTMTLELQNTIEDTASGQSVVLYHADEIVAGGIIC